MDAVFLNPPFFPKFSRYSRSPCITRGGTLYYPLMECIAATFAEGKGFKTKVIDSIADSISKEKTLKMIKELNPKLVAVATSTPSIYNDIEIANDIKEALPKATIALVGRHVSWASEETLKKSKVDCILINEYYIQAVQILQGIKFDRIRGITYKKDRKIKISPEGKPIEPNEVPLISPIIKRDLKIENYFYASLKNPYIMLQNSWGCAFSCDFCNEMYKSSYRHRKPEITIEELKFIERELPKVKEVLFDDPTFVINEEHTKELCEMMIKEKIKLTWSCNLRCNVSLDLLKLMKKAGCRLAHVGVESLTQEGKNSINKRMTLDKEIEFLNDSKKAGILIHGCFIIGLPGDTKESIKLTIQRAKKLPMDSIQVFPLIPTPNTITWKWAKDNGYLTTEDYSQWLKPDGSYNSVISQPKLTNKDIEEMVETFYKEWYFRPSFILYKLKQSLKSWQELKRNFISFKNMMRR